MISTDLQEQLNRVNCGVAGVLGTGTNNCPFNRKRVIAAIFTTQGFEFEEALSAAYLQELQMRGIAIVVSKVIGFEDATAEDNITTYAGSNIKSTAGKSPYEYVALFDNGIYFHKAIASMAGFANYDVTYVDEALNVTFTASSTAAKGFALGQLDFRPYKGSNGTDQAQEALWWQELYRYEFDQDAAWITSANHDIRPATLDGVNDAVVTIEVIPSATDTTIQFSVKTKADTKDVDLGGLIIADLEYTVNGVTTTITGTVTQDTSTKWYTITVPAVDAGENLGLRLNNSTYTTGIMVKGNRLYKSNTYLVTAIA